jgi:hypothetical protein
MVAMARGWLASAELPATFWYYAVKRAAEICNYFPIQLEDGAWSTPLELAHATKPDLRVLFKMFGLAAVRRERVGDSKLGKFDSQSVPMIAVGRCSTSNMVYCFIIQSTVPSFRPWITNFNIIQPVVLILATSTNQEHFSIDLTKLILYFRRNLL